MVKGKVEICSCNPANFFGIERIAEFSLYKRYDVLRAIIQAEAKEEYWHFLAQPVIGLDKTITWYSIPFNEVPRHYDELSGEEKVKFSLIKEATISHYNSVITKLKNQNNLIEKEYIEKAFNYIDERFLYCFDGKVVLGIWGMRPNPNQNKNSGEFAVDLFLKKYPTEKFDITFNVFNNSKTTEISKISKEKGSRIENDEIPIIPNEEGFEFIGWDEDPNYHIVNGHKIFTAHFKETQSTESGLANEENLSEPILEPDVNDRHNVVFIDGGYGDLVGPTKKVVNEGEFLADSDIPEVVAKEGYIFKGWNLNPYNYQVFSDTEFVAQYDKVIVKERFWNRIWKWLRLVFSKGCLKWLLGLIILLFLFWLLSSLIHSCNSQKDVSNIGGGGENRGGGIDRPGSSDRGDQVKDPVEDFKGGYEFLPVTPGVIPPIDTLNFGYSKDSVTRIVSDRLNILLEGNSNGLIALFAKDFKTAYPSNEYQIVYYDTLLKILQILVPPLERERIKKDLPLRLSNYKMFIWDETLFESTIKLNDPSLKNIKQSWQIKACQVYDAWDITLGDKEIVIAIIDDGFDLEHPEFSGKIVKPYNVWTKNNKVSTSITGHGTHVAGIALATANNGIGIAGIAPNCSFMPVQVADNTNIMTITSILEGVLYAIYQGADVINISLGMVLNFQASPWSKQRQGELVRNHFKEEERLWAEVFKIADAHNATLVLAAGNENILAGVDPFHRPSQAITVSAIEEINKPFSKSSFSNFGDYSTISAPGVHIYSTYGKSGYAYLDGTSMAAPIVSGTIALMKSIDKSITTSSIKKILIETGIPVKGDVGNLIQVGKAIKAVSDGNFNKDNIDDCEKIKIENDSLKKEIKKRFN